MESFTPLLTTYDWNQEWKELQPFLPGARKSSYWDMRAQDFASFNKSDLYCKRFLERANIEAKDTVFDMGCGTGALSIALAQTKHKVLAADFSLGMLERLQKELATRNIKDITTKCLNWDEDWKSAGMKPDTFDVCIASRSLMTSDLKAALLKLTDVARRRVCITLSTGLSPRFDSRMLGEIGLEKMVRHDHIYAFNILVNEGMKPELSYIESRRKDTFDSVLAAREFYTHMIDMATKGCISAEERALACKRLDKWLDENLVENECAGQLDGTGCAEGALRVVEPRLISWAFIAWNK